MDELMLRLRDEPGQRKQVMMMANEVLLGAHGVLFDQDVSNHQHGSDLFTREQRAYLSDFRGANRQYWRDRLRRRRERASGQSHTGSSNEP